MIRLATTDDKADILELLKSAPYRHIHADWRLPVDWLGDPGFVVMPKAPLPAAVETVASRLFGQRSQLLGCLAATADPPPAAWVRAAALAYVEQPEVALGKMVDTACANLRAAGVRKLAWLVIDGWPLPWLPALQFEQVNEIITLLKSDLSMPDVRMVPDLIIRPVEEADADRLAEIEAEAFGPLWRHSAEALRLAQRQTVSFDVAVWRGHVVGFQFSTPAQGEGAHLARMTVHPDVQGVGVGSVLLTEAIRQFRRRGLLFVTLNTQIDNAPSLRLYQKFGFRDTDQRLPVWVRTL